MIFVSAAVKPDHHEHTARPAGRLQPSGLPPGRYLISAVDYLQAGQERDPKTLERLRADATAVTLTDGATENVPLRLSP